MEQKETHANSFTTFDLLAGIGLALMALQFVGIINVGWLLIFHYWLLLIAVQCLLWLVIMIVGGIVAIIQSHKGE